jgi:hypothetical protein
MTELTWDGVNQKRFETGVDHGVLYLPNDQGEYDTGVSWNGLTTVTESPTGAESNKTYADNIIYGNLISIEEFAGTIAAYTYPNEFGECDGSAEPEVGVSIGQQPRRTFGFAYRTRVGDDGAAVRGYKLHLVWGALATPSEKAYATVNDSPEMIEFSWDFTTTPVGVGTINGKDYAPTASMVIDSTRVDADSYSDLEALLYGTAGTDPELPTPADVVALFAGTNTDVRLTAANAPTYNSGTHVVTLPSVTGITWKINGVTKTAGAQPAMSTGQTSYITAHAQPGYVVDGDNDWTYDY